MRPEDKELVEAVDHFAMLMKERLVAKSVENIKKGKSKPIPTWKDVPFNQVCNEIYARLGRMQNESGPTNEPEYVFIGIANWALIGFLNAKK